MSRRLRDGRPEMKSWALSVFRKARARLLTNSKFLPSGAFLQRALTAVPLDLGQLSSPHGTHKKVPFIARLALVLAEA